VREEGSVATELVLKGPRVKEYTISILNSILYRLQAELEFLKNLWGLGTE
jgi:hypothetical protein